MKNVRFWVHINDDVVKLTLKPGELVKHTYNVPGEHIFSQVWLYHLLGNEVEYSWNQGIHLKDGWFFSKATTYCNVGELQHWAEDLLFFRTEELLLFPNWKVL